MSGADKLPFPTLLSFTIWSNRVPQPGVEDRESYEQPTSDGSVPLTAPEGMPASVLFFSDRASKMSIEKRNRHIGLVQGLVDFTAVLGFNFASRNRASDRYQQPPGMPQKVDLDSRIRVVHSSNNKLLYIEPEAGFHFCAVSLDFLLIGSDQVVQNLGITTLMGLLI